MRAQFHVVGPEPGDVVAVTDVAVIEAIAEGTLDVAGAAEQGLLRLYGAPDDVAPRAPGCSPPRAADASTGCRTPGVL